MMTMNLQTIGIMAGDYLTRSLPNVGFSVHEAATKDTE